MCLPLILLGACQSDSPFSHDGHIANLRFIGDSISRLLAKHYNGEVKITNDAENGSGVERLERQAHSCIGQHVVIVCGTNDLQHCHSHEQIESYADRYMAALRHLDAHHIFLFGVPPRGSFPGGGDADETIRYFNSLVSRGLADEHDISYIDLYDKMQNPDGSVVEALYQKDKLHPSRAGALFMLRALSHHISSHHSSQF